MKYNLIKGTCEFLGSLSVGRSRWASSMLMAEQELCEHRNLGSDLGGRLLETNSVVVAKKEDGQACKPVLKGSLRRRLSVKGCVSASVMEDSVQERLKEAMGQLGCGYVHADSFTYASLLRSCGNARALSEGRCVHAHIMRNGYDQDRFLGNLLVQMYGNCGSLEDARAVFDSMPQRNLYSWNLMIAAYSRNWHFDNAISLFDKMQLEAVKPDMIAFISILNACASLTALSEGKEIHARIVEGGLETNVVVGTALINMYGKCRSLEDAIGIFGKIYHPDVVFFTAMIAACAQNGRGKDALTLFQQMLLEGVKPDKVTFITILDACAGLAALLEGKMIHASIVHNGFNSNVVVGTALVNFYGKCGRVEDAINVFDKMPLRNAVSWTAIVAAYSQNGYGKEAVKLFRQMQLEGLKPSRITFICILDACSILASLAEGKEIHARLVDGGFQSDDVTVWNAVAHMYGKCKSVDDARSVFDKMQERNVVSWTTMITAYAQNGHGKDALKLFQRMQLEGVKSDRITFISILDTCGSLAALREGKEIHARIVESGFETDVVVGTALVNMYGKCGNADDARNVFDKLSQRSVVSWNAMIAAYAQNGHGKEALKLLGQMALDGVKPDKITFASILSACSYAGLLDDSWCSFVSMKRDHGITPMVEHYRCMVDVLGRAGQLDQAEDLINSMPFEPDAVSWMTLLASCKVHGDVDRGAWAAEHVFELDQNNDSPYVVLSNIYAKAGKWCDVAKVRKAMRDKGVKKQQGRSCIEVKKGIHEFVVKDRLHPREEDIYVELQRLNKQLKEAGYVSDIKAVLRDVKVERKEHLLSYHSEKLAIAFGLIATPPGTPLHIIKNLRVCSDCHALAKFISRSVERKIIMRDANRFHHFEHGVCSCGDYW